MSVYVLFYKTSCLGIVLLLLLLLDQVYGIGRKFVEVSNDISSALSSKGWCLSKFQPRLGVLNISPI